MRDRMADEPDLTHQSGGCAPRPPDLGLLIAVFDPVRLMLGEGRREGVIAGAVVLRDEVQVGHVGWLRGSLERCLSGAADRRRREPRDLVRVVR